MSSLGGAISARKASRASSFGNGGQNVELDDVLEASSSIGGGGDGAMPTERGGEFIVAIVAMRSRRRVWKKWEGEKS
jgi:hypothetical protein